MEFLRNLVGRGNARSKEKVLIRIYLSTVAPIAGKQNVVAGAYDQAMQRGAQAVSGFPRDMMTQSQTAKAAAQEALDDMASVDVPDAARDHWPSYTDLMRNSIEQLETDLETHAAMLNGQPVSSLQSKSAAQVANAKSLSTQVEAEILRLARMAGLSASETQEIGAEAQGAR